MLKILKQTLGIPLTALLIGVVIFILPKIIHDDYIFYKKAIEEIKK